MSEAFKFVIKVKHSRHLSEVLVFEYDEDLALEYLKSFLELSDVECIAREKITMHYPKMSIQSGAHPDIFKGWVNGKFNCVERSIVWGETDFYGMRVIEGSL